MGRGVKLSKPTVCMCALWYSSVSAMGGHFDVDDAAVLAAGRCQVEIWAALARVRGQHGQHAGPGCRIGPVELGINVDRAVEQGLRESNATAQLKWVVDPVLPHLSAGLVVGIGRQLGQGGGATASLFTPVTVFASEEWQFHFNVGTDRSADGVRTRRVGLAGEWVVSDRFSVIAEHIRLLGDSNSRIGVRVGLGDTTSIDMSLARTVNGRDRRWSVGLNQEFGR